MDKVTINPSELSTRNGAGYIPSEVFRSHHDRHRPLFHRYWIEKMLATPKIQMGLRTLKGPIVTKGASKYEVVSDDTDIAEQVDRLMKRFFTVAAKGVLEALEWGYSTHSFRYEHDPGTKDFNLVEAERFKPTDSKVLVNKKKDIIGFRVPRGNKEVEVLRPRSFHFVHNKEKNRFYGESCLFGAFLPWIKQWGVGALEDIEKLWFAKNCYNSGVIYYAKGSTRVGGVVQDNALIAQTIASQMATGNIITIEVDATSSMTVDGKGDGIQTKWWFQKGETTTVPGGLLESMQECKMEQLEGMGIFTEVVTNNGEGHGSATGRSIPTDLFYTTLQEILNNLIWEARRQYVLPLLQINNKTTLDKLPPFEITPTPLDQDLVLTADGELEEQENVSESLSEGKEGEQKRKEQGESRTELARKKGQARNPGNRGASAAA